MKLRCMLSGERSSYMAITKENGDCPVLSFSEVLPADMEKVRDGFWRYLDYAADHGWQKLPGDVAKPTSTEGIIEFKKGRLRLYFFEDGEELVVVTSGHLKEDKKTQSKLINKAKKIMDEYFELKKTTDIEVIDD